MNVANIFLDGQKMNYFEKICTLSFEIKKKIFKFKESGTKIALMSIKK